MHLMALSILTLFSLTKADIPCKQIEGPEGGLVNLLKKYNCKRGDVQTSQHLSSIYGLETYVLKSDKNESQFYITKHNLKDRVVATNFDKKLTLLREEIKGHNLRHMVSCAQNAEYGYLVFFPKKAFSHVFDYPKGADRNTVEKFLLNIIQLFVDMGRRGYLIFEPGFETIGFNPNDIQYPVIINYNSIYKSDAFIYFCNPLAVDTYQKYAIKMSGNINRSICRQARFHQKILLYSLFRYLSYVAAMLTSPQFALNDKKLVWDLEKFKVAMDSYANLAHIDSAQNELWRLAAREVRIKVNEQILFGGAAQ